MLAIDADKNADMKRAILRLRADRFTTAEILRILKISERTLRRREAEIRRMRDALGAG